MKRQNENCITILEQLKSNYIIKHGTFINVLGHCDGNILHKHYEGFAKTKFETPKCATQLMRSQD